VTQTWPIFGSGSGIVLKWHVCADVCVTPCNGTPADARSAACVVRKHRRRNTQTCRSMVGELF
jgi:hypothetical protein